LTTDHRTGDAPIDVRVADLDALEPAVDLGRIEAEDAAGQAEHDVVLQRDRVVEIVGTHHSENGAEALRAMKEASSTYTQLHAGGPELIAPLPARLDEPCLTDIEAGERPLELS
jgi:hypothetical protein